MPAENLEDFQLNSLKQDLSNYAIYRIKKDNIMKLLLMQANLEHQTNLIV